MTASSCGLPYLVARGCTRICQGGRGVGGSCMAQHGAREGAVVWCTDTLKVMTVMTVGDWHSIFGVSSSYLVSRIV
jgi:hypothetical protein